MIVFILIINLSLVMSQSTIDDSVSNEPTCCRDSCKSSKVMHYEDCDHAQREGQTKSGMYLIKPKLSENLMKILPFHDSRPDPFYVYCDMVTDGGGWLVFQRRKDGSVDFYRPWLDYRNGFGDLTGEMWLGNEKLYFITSQKNYTLRVDMQDFEANERHALYREFSIGPETINYTLHVKGYSGNAGRSFYGHDGYEFSTLDRDNDIYGVSCAKLYKGGWWYRNCHSSNLNGLYLKGNHTSYANGVNWRDWKGYHYSLKLTEMKVRPAK